MKPCFPCILAVLLAVAAIPADAQNASAPLADETLVLNPFTVSTAMDRGYAASSTLAGTRLNTSLRDVAAAVTVITPEFMADLGAFTLQDAVGFTVNAELNPTNFNTVNNTVASARIRGARVNGNTQDFFNTQLPLDIYSLDQISINRGPNSLLFGVGNPAGTLTGVGKRAIFTNRYEVGASFDRWDGWRATLDLNQVIVPQRVALRVAALHRDTKHFLRPSFWEEDRLYFAGTGRLFMRRHWNSTLRFNAEFATSDRVVPDLRTPADIISPWINAGSNLVSGIRGATTVALLPPGNVRAAGTNQLVVIDGSPTAIPVLNWLNTARGGVTGFQNRALNNSSPIPIALNYNGATRSSGYDGNNFTFFLEQELGEATSVELAYGQSDRDLDWVRSDGGGQIFVDTNRLLPNGEPNPNAGKYYTQGTNRLQKQYDLSRQVRATASHAVDLRRTSAWLGQHRFGALASREFGTFALDDYYETNGTPLAGFPSRIDNVQNRLVRRSYIYNGAGNVWQAGRTFDEIPAVNSGGITSRYYNERPLRNDSRTDSLVLALQSKTLKDRLATTFGYRWDDLKGYNLAPATTVRRADGEFPGWRALPLETSPSSTLKNGTFTGGIVLHVLPQLSFQANQSETSAPAPGLFDMYGRTLPTPVGTGEDYGVKFSLLGGRLTGTLTRYKSTQDNQAISSIQALGPRISAIGTVLNLPQLIAVTDPRDTQDVVAKGYELELIYNPTANWRLALNASRNNNVLNNVNSRAAAFLTEVIYPLETQFGAAVVPSGQTVRQEINDFRTSIRNNKTAVEGQQAELLREWNGNLVTNYRFSTGRAKGINLGGNIQYRGSAVIGSLVNPTTNLPDFANPLKGTGYTIVGVHVRYERRVFGKYDWNVSLHVRNLLDEDRLIEKSASATDGAILIYDQLEPRTWLLSTGVKF